MKRLLSTFLFFALILPLGSAFADGFSRLRRMFHHEPKYKPIESKVPGLERVPSKATQLAPPTQPRPFLHNVLGGKLKAPVRADGVAYRAPSMRKRLLGEKHSANPAELMNGLEHLLSPLTKGMDKQDRVVLSQVYKPGSQLDDVQKAAVLAYEKHKTDLNARHVMTNDFQSRRREVREGDSLVYQYQAKDVLEIEKKQKQNLTLADHAEQARLGIEFDIKETTMGKAVRSDITGPMERAGFAQPTFKYLDPAFLELVKKNGYK